MKNMVSLLRNQLDLQEEITENYKREAMLARQYNGGEWIAAWLNWPSILTNIYISPLDAFYIGVNPSECQMWHYQLQALCARMNYSQ